MTRLMIEGDVDGTYCLPHERGSQSKSSHNHKITCAVTAAAVRAGWSFHQARHVFLESPSSAGRHAREILHRSGHEVASLYLERVWERARTLVAATCISDRQDAVADLIALKDAISTASWRGTSGSTDLKVLMAHWQAGMRCGGRVHTLSCREAAEMAGCTAMTALKSARRLEKQGWLRQVDSGTHEHGSTWALLDASQQRDTSRGAQPGGARPNVSTVRDGDLDAGVIADLMALDAFAHRGLGASSMKLLAALKVRDGQSVQELVASAMVSQATAYRHLARLAEHGLVAKTLEVWELTQTAAEALSGAWDGWDAVAGQIGTQGTAQRRRELHRAQRLAWHEITLPRLRERRMPDVTPIRGDEVEPAWVVDGFAIDPATGEIIEDLVVASDGRLMLVVDEPDYDELMRRNALACAA